MSRELDVEHHAMAVNPYDRRSQRASHFADGMSFSAEFATPASAVAMDDLNAMASSAFVRGQVETEDRLREQHAAAMLTAKRVAWNEGHEQGTIEGRDAHAKVIAGEAVDIVVRLIEVTCNDRATRAELRAVAIEAKELLRRLAGGSVG